MIDIIVSSYNSLFLLQTFIFHLNNQTNKNFNLIVADDGSSDGTIPWLEKNKIDYVTQKDEGFQLAKIRNKAFTLSKSKYVMFTDCDCMFAPNLISEFNKKIKSKNTIYCFPRYELFKNGLIKPLFWDEVPIKDTFIGSNIICEKKYIKMINGFDETYTEYGFEDIDLIERFYLLGFKFEKIKTSKYYHINHRDQNKVSKDSENMRNKFYEKFESEYVNLCV
jgi:glycosyltransferase involved in cell wall biosynthesis